MKELPIVLNSIKKTELLSEIEKILLEKLNCFSLQKNIEIKKFKKVTTENLRNFKEELDFIFVNSDLAQKISLSTLPLVFIASVLREYESQLELNKLSLRQSVEFKYIQYRAEYESAFSLLIDILKNYEINNLGLLPDVLLKSSFNLIKALHDLIQTIRITDSSGAKIADFIETAIKQTNSLIDLLLLDSKYKHLEYKDILQEIAMA